MPSLFGFGKRRRRVKRSSKKAKASRKPPARLLKICKKYHVKATKKVGGRRCYKSIACLKRCCLKKARAMKKKLMKMAKRKKMVKRSSKKVSRRRTNRRRTNRMDGDDDDEDLMSSFGKRRRTNCRRTSMGKDEEMNFGARRRIPMFGSTSGVVSTIPRPRSRGPPPDRRRASLFGRRSRFGTGKNQSASKSVGQQMGAIQSMTIESKIAQEESNKANLLKYNGILDYDKNCKNNGMQTQLACIHSTMRFGKGRRTGAKVSKAKAMKAFRSFYKRHCKGRGARFGNGGNPMLSSSMGYEFCPNGMGGVLGANSTGLFPSPCTSYNSSAGDAEMAQDLILPDYSEPTTAFGKRRRRRSTAVTRKRTPMCKRRRRRSTAVGGVRRRRRRSTAAGCSSMKVGGARRRRRSTRSSMYA